MEIIRKTEHLNKLNRLVQSKLDPTLSAHCRVANLRDGILVLTTSSPAFGHLLRFKSIDLLSALRAEPQWCGLKSIQTRVCPEHPLTLAALPLVQSNAKEQALGSMGPSLSVQSAELLKNTANNIQSPRLRHALLKLASR